MVLLAGVFEVLLDIPLSGGVGDRTRTPTTAEAEYRWGVGKMTLDLRRAQDLTGEEISASVVVGELVVIVPDDVPLVIEARAGLGEVVVLGESADGVDPSVECYGSSRAIDCSSRATEASERSLHLILEVGTGQGGGAAMKEHPGTFVAGIVFMLVGAAYLLHALDVWNVSVWRLWPVGVIALGVVVLIGGMQARRRD